MKYLNLLRTSAREAIINKISWLYISVALVGQMAATSSPLSKAIPSINSASSEIWILSTILSWTFISALVYAVSQKELHNLASSVFNSWQKGWSKIIQVAVLNILIFIVLFVLMALVEVLLKQTIPYGVLRMLIIAPFLRPFLDFGICAIIINNSSILTAVRTSLSAFIRNITQTLVIGGILILIQQVFLNIIVLVFMRQYGYMLVTSPIKMLDLPQVLFWDQVIALVMSPSIVIVFTRLYLSFMNASESTILSTSQEAAYRLTAVSREGQE